MPMRNSREYKRVLNSIIRTWPVWKQKLANRELITSTHGEKLPETQIPDGDGKHTSNVGEIIIPYPGGAKKDDGSVYSLTVSELADALEENAEWVGDNNYEVPITLYDHLLMGARAIRILQAMAENGSSALDTGRRLSDVVYTTTEALQAAVSIIEQQDKALDIMATAAVRNSERPAYCHNIYCQKHDPNNEKICAECLCKLVYEVAGQELAQARDDIEG